ncbi:MAG TPA: GYD domain-containing protein [Terracidiphilus sp.]
MASYLVQASYTSEALASLIKSPEDRTAVVKKVAKKLGGKLSASWLSFGEYDLVMIVEMPDNASMASFAIAAFAGGSLKGVKTTALMSTDEALSAVKKAAKSGYRPIGAKK